MIEDVTNDEVDKANTPLEIVVSVVGIEEITQLLLLVLWRFDGLPAGKIAAGGPNVGRA